MLKTIPKSNVSKRAFQVYKEWEASNLDYPLISASVELGLFETGSSNNQNGIYTTPLYRSVQSKFYNTETPNLFNTFGRYTNLASLANERQLSDTIYVLSLPQTKYGERIKPGSFSFVNGGIDYLDNSKGAINSKFPSYNIDVLDFQTNEIILSDNDGDVFEGTIIFFDAESGEMRAIFNSDDDTFVVIRLDFQTGVIQTRVELDFDGLEIDELIFGNIFYENGQIVFRDIGVSTHEYNINYRSTKTIYETEVLITARAGEFNYSQNPSAIKLTTSGSYFGEITPVTNQIVGTETKKYKVIQDIRRKEYFTGSVTSSVTNDYVSGSWDDYFENRETDPTGSYLTPYITTIGLYDNEGELVAIAKLPTPIKNLPDYDMNFIVRFDT